MPEMTLFAGPGTSSQIIATFTVKGEPASKARPRFDHRGSKSHAYTPEKTKLAENRVCAAFLEAAHKKGTDTETAYGVLAHFYSGTHQRRDVDNMVKLILDGLNGVAFPDDSQVVEIVGRKSFVARSDARTEVTVYKVGRVDRLTRACAFCGKDFTTYPSVADKKMYCSTKCREAHKIKRREVVCINCGKTFLAWGEVKAATRKYCSKECAKEHRSVTVACTICGAEFSRYACHVREHNYCSKECATKAVVEEHRNRRTTHFPGKCLICGAGTTRKEYRRCNHCKRAGKTIPITPECN